MKVISLQSGSNGNCYYVESSGTRLLFDAGISGRQAELRLAKHGRDIRTVDALFISHDHRDHSAAMGVFQRKYGMPIYVTNKTLGATRRYCQIGPMQRVRLFAAGQSQSFGDVTVHSVPTPHDSEDGVAFVIEDSQHRLGILTDLGHVFDGLREVLRSLDAVVIESNYDLAMLESGRYPESLKRRIKGQGGHLSNKEAADLLLHDRSDRLKWACLCHLSEENNRPDLAKKTHQQILGSDLPIFVASRYHVSDVMEL